MEKNPSELLHYDGVFNNNHGAIIHGPPLWSTVDHQTLSEVSTAILARIFWTSLLELYTEGSDGGYLILVARSIWNYSTVQNTPVLYAYTD